MEFNQHSGISQINGTIYGYFGYINKSFSQKYVEIGFRYVHTFIYIYVSITHTFNGSWNPGTMLDKNMTRGFET